MLRQRGSWTRWNVRSVRSVRSGGPRTLAFYTVVAHNDIHGPPSRSTSTGDTGPGQLADATVTVVENDIHPERTTGTRKAQYMFTTKHHGGDPGAAQWAVDRDQEFSIFNSADVHDLVDESGNLYGILPSRDGGLCYL